MTKYTNHAEGGTDDWFSPVAGTPFFVDELRVDGFGTAFGPRRECGERAPWDGAVWYLDEIPDVSLPGLDHLHMDQSESVFVKRVDTTLAETGHARYGMNTYFTTMPTRDKGLGSVVGPDGVQSKVSIAPDGSMSFWTADGVTVVAEQKVPLGKWCRLDAGPGYATVTVLPSGE